MNATSYYLSTCRLVIQADPANQNRFQEIFQLLPMLRNSLSCTVCENLLVEPFTPEETSCQHHVCQDCQGGKKSLTPSCSWCKDYSKYTQNPQLKILLQSYRSLCSYIKVTPLYQMLKSNKEFGDQMVEIIRESQIGLSHVTSPYDETISPVPLGLTQTLSALNTRRGEEEEVVSEMEVGVEGETDYDDIPIYSKVHIKDGDSSSTLEDGETSEKTEGRWFCVTNGGQLIPEDSLNSPLAEDECKLSTVGENDDRLPSISPPSTRRSVGSPRRLRKERPSPLVVKEPTAAKIKDEVFTSPEVKIENQSYCVDEEISFRISSPAVKALFCDTSNNIKHEEDDHAHAKDIPVSRSDTPSPPNSSKYLNLQESGRMKITESYILKPRQGSGSSPSKHIKLTPSVRVPVMLSRTLDSASLPPPAATSSSPATNYVTVDYNNTVAAATQRHHSESGGSLLRPLIGDSGIVDPLTNSSSTPTTTSSLAGGGRVKKDDGKGEKHGCRCGNATSTPGKLTCCGQRCPCYVNRSACLGCKCKGCNNPNLPGGGKLLPYLDIAMSSKNSSKLYTYSAKTSSSGSGGNTQGYNIITTGKGVVVSGVSVNGFWSSGTSSSPTISTRAKLTTVGLSPSKQLPGCTGLVLPGARVATLYPACSTSTSTSSFVQIPAASQSQQSVSNIDINSIPVVNLSTTPNSVRTLLSPAAVQRLLKSSSVASSTTSNSISTSSPLSTVTIPISSLGSAGLKLRPVQQIQGKRVIPTTIRVRGPPYSRIPLNGKLSHVKLQTVSLVTLLKNQKNIQVVRQESEDTENTPTSS